jgi:hypothetical protein
MKAKIIRIILIVAGCLVALLLLVQSCKIKKLEKANQLQAVEIMTAKDSVKTMVTKNGEMYFDMIAATVDASALKNALAENGLVIKELRARGIAINQIVSTLKAQLAVAGHDTINLRDTIINVVNGTPLPAQSFNWTNTFLSLSGLINDKRLVMDYIYKTDLTMIQTQKGKSVMVTGYLSDPNARIVTGSSIIVTHKVHWYEKPWIWGVAGMGLGYYLCK